MYRVCINCPKLGVSCDGGNLLTMPQPELLEWMRLRKKVRNLSVHTISVLSGVPEGTVARVFAPDAKADFRLESLRPIVCVLIGGDLGKNPCPDPADETSATWLRDQIIYRDGVISDLRSRLEAEAKENHESSAILRQELAEEKAEHNADVAYYRTQAESLRRFTRLLSAALVVILVALAVITTYEALHGHIGWINF